MFNLEPNPQTVDCNAPQASRIVQTCDTFFMLPLNCWTLAARSRITGILTDVDDTLTTDGAITPDALAALGQLQARGIQVIAITGRPVGWSEPFAMAWPVAAVVAENGAVLLRKSSKYDLQPNEDGGNQLLKSYQQSHQARLANFARMQQISQRVLLEVPGALLAQDSGWRETDMAIDHSEFTQLPPEKIAQVVAIMQSEGMNATVSSIHINGWFGAHNKLTGACWAVRELFGRDLLLEICNWAFVGDSTNDQLMFEAFANSVGVANVQRFAAQLAHLPRYITDGTRGAGFAEVSRAVLTAQENQASRCSPSQLVDTHDSPLG